MPVLHARAVLAVRATQDLRVQAGNARRDGRLPARAGNRPRSQGLRGYPRRACRVCRAAVLPGPAPPRVHRVPADTPAAHAAFAEPLSCALHAVERATIGIDDVVVVAGAGPIGLGMIAGAHLRTPKLVVALDFDPKRRDLALACGADLAFEPTEAMDEVLKLTGGYGCDVYMEATGHPAAVPQGLQMLRKAGTFVEYSVMREPVTVDWTIIGDTKELD